MKIIDLQTWERTPQYMFFRRMDYPQYNVCVNIDVTRFVETAAERGLPFYYAMLYTANQSLNAVKEFRYRIRGEQVVLHDVVHPSFTDMDEGSDLFKVVVADMEPDMETFAARAAEKSARQRDFAVAGDIEGRDDLIYYTCLPWVSFTNLSHTISLNRDDSVPRVSWGRYFSSEGRILLPFSVQAHHAFVDGVHIGRYVDGLQKCLDTI